jgi:hypothetical protein
MFGEKRFRRQKCELLQLKLCASNDEQVTIEALNFPVICFPVSATINLDNHPHLNGIQLADKSNASDPIDVLISSDYHAVVRSDHNTTKLRVVYDSSAKTIDRPYSMNDCLEVGPNFMPQLIDILMKFRWHKIGLTVDIEKAFLMVAINESDRDMLRFLWLKDPADLNSDILQLRFTRLVFGLRPSPEILGLTIRHHLDTQKDVNPELIEILKNLFYVDDFISGADDEKKVFDLTNSAKTVMKRGTFNLRKWNTNSSSVQEKLPEMDIHMKTAPKHSSVNVVDQSYSESVMCKYIGVTNGSVKVLDTIWNKSSDGLEFKFTDLVEEAKALPATKRSLLKVIGKIFDPLGFLSLFIIRWKVLFQILCI